MIVPNSATMKNVTTGKTIFMYILVASLLLNPAVGLFIGLAFALVNWWIIDMRDKIVPYLIASLVVGLLVNWVGYEHIRESSFDANYLSLPLVILGILIVIAFAYHLWRQTNNDIELFRVSQKEFSESPRWNWSAYFFTLLFLWLLIMLVMNTLSRSLGYCQFPTLPDIVGRVVDNNREGVGKLVMRSGDFGCGVNFWFQVSEKPDPLFTSHTTTDSYSRTIFFRYFNKNPMSYTNSDIDHYVWLETDPTVIAKIERIPNRYDNFAEKILDLPIIQLTPEPDLMRVTCDGYEGDEGIYCSVRIVRGSIVSVLNFDSANLPPDEFWRIFNSVIVSTDKRIQEYQSQ